MDPSTESAYQSVVTDQRSVTPGAVPHRDGMEGYLQFALRAIHEVPGDLNTAFFGEGNVERLHARIRKDVKRLTGRSMARQSDQALVIIMVGIYSNAGNLWNARGLSAATQLGKLNNAVLRVCVRQCVEGIVGMSAYVRDTASNATPIQRPINPSSKGSRVLPGMLPL
jgi:hypothetical protein